MAIVFDAKVSLLIDENLFNLIEDTSMFNKGDKIKFYWHGRIINVTVVSDTDEGLSVV